MSSLEPWFDNQIGQQQLNRERNVLLTEKRTEYYTKNLCFSRDKFCKLNVLVRTLIRSMQYSLLYNEGIGKKCGYNVVVYYANYNQYKMRCHRCFFSLI